jgi:hypothetical protein
MEDKMARFSKKVEPFNTDTKEKVNLSTYKSLIAKIQSKVSQRASVLKERPIQQDSDAKPVQKKEFSGTTKPLHSFNLTASRLSAINKSIISRMSNERGTKQQISNTSRLKSRPKESGSRDRSTLKERINRLSTLERNLKEKEVKRDILTTKKIGSKIPAPTIGGLSLLQKFQIHQVKNQPTDRSKSSKEGSSSNGTSSALIGKTESPNIKFNQGLDLLKKRIAQLPGRSGTQIESIDTAKMSTRRKDPVDQPTEPKSTNEGESPTININLYKKKVDPLSYKRDDQNSLKMLKARRSPDNTEGKRIHTITGAPKIRIKDRETTLN